jgi:hypothetical protein
MEVIEIEVYTFEELESEAKEKARAWSRDCLEYPWFCESIDSIRAFCKHFGVNLMDWEAESRDASKVALAHLIARLKIGRFDLLDTQFITPHLASLGAVEISRDAYLEKLEAALLRQANFYVWPKNYSVSGIEALSALTLEGA